MQLAELKKEMRFNAELLSLIGTLKNIAASRYHTLERDKERFDQFMTSFADFFRCVDLAEVDNPLVKQVADVLGIIIVTSDSGFMGGLNAGVIDAAFHAQGDISDDKTRLIVVGDKGAGRLMDIGREYKFFKGIADETRYEQALEMTDYVVNEVKERRIGKLVMVYPKPESFSKQIIDTINVLPCAALFDKSADSEIAKLADHKPQKAFADARKVIVESSFTDMVEYLARTWLTSQLFEAFEDSKLSEYAARAMHLEGSNQKLEKDFKKLKYQFFRASHEKIDKGMRESFSAGNIRKKKRAAAVKADRAEAAAAALNS